jgi:diacylglycerol O-acyltransferase / wax synthase
MTNVPGPRETVCLAGVPLRAVLAWAPTAGSVGMSVSIFSYRGAVTTGLLVHTRLVPDPERIVARLQREVVELAKLPPRVA